MTPLPRRSRRSARPRHVGGSSRFSSLIGVIHRIDDPGDRAAGGIHGILQGILALLTQFDHPVQPDNTTVITFIDAMSSSMFYFLPIIIGFTARVAWAPIRSSSRSSAACWCSLR